MRISALCRFIGTLAALFSLAAADYQYHSRPDLSPPRLNITVPASSGRVSDGLIFVAPYGGFGPGASGPSQPGAYIFRDDGELVWSGVGSFGGWVANFRPDEWHRRPVLRAFQGLLDASHGRMYGTHAVLNQSYETVQTVKAGAHRLVSAHEFRIISGRTVLVETPVAEPVGLRRWGGGPGQDWIVSGGFQELDIETGELLFEWYSLDHVDPRYSAFPLRKGEPHNGTGRNTTDAWNYFHINSVDKDDEGNYLISARNYAAIFKIDGRTGRVLWQLGGFHGGSSFIVAPDARFAYQHDARFLSRSPDGNEEVISLFDNSAHSVGIKTNESSRARIIRLDHTAGTAEAVRTYPAPDGLSAPSQGNVQVLGNGNVFVNWGQAGAITEFSRDGEVLFHAYLDSAPEGHLVQSYRGFRYNWTGISTEEPAIVALHGGESSGSGRHIAVYVSWNGDAETRAWRFSAQTTPEAFGASNQNTNRVLGEVKRTGFETKLKLDVHDKSLKDAVAVFAEALNERGNVVARTRAVTVSSRKAVLGYLGIEQQNAELVSSGEL